MVAIQIEKSIQNFTHARKPQLTHTTPPLTVALLTYNRLHYLQECIPAITNQTFGDFEFLILDNCSTDGTSDFILDLKDTRIRYIRNAPHTSVQFNCISAYHIASGHRVIATHDDDIMENDMLARQMDFLDRNQNTGLVWTTVSDIDHNSKNISKIKTPLEDKLFEPGEYIKSFLRERIWPMPSGVMFTRKALPKQYINRYYGTTAQYRNRKPMDQAGTEDILFPAYINRKYSIGYIGTPLLKRRIHTNQFSHNAALSRPGIYLYKRLKEIANRIPNFENENFHFDTHMARFDIQEKITCTASSKIPTKYKVRIQIIFNQLKNNINTNPDACLAGLPIILLAHLLESDFDLNWLEKLDATGHTKSTQKLLTWAKSYYKKNIIRRWPTQQRIILFGSALIAAIIILELKQANIEIVACIDSNITRQGQKLLGIPIHPPTWMMEHIKSNDFIMITSERDHEHYIEAVILNNLKESATIETWKNLID